MIIKSSKKLYNYNFLPQTPLQLNTPLDSKSGEFIKYIKFKNHKLVMKLGFVLIAAYKIV